NNVFGLLLPQSVLPSISGPVLGTRSLGDSVWGSAAGVLLSWEAVDFGQRKAGVDVARAQTSLAKSQTALTELDVAAAAADAFITVLAADESVRAARANVERLQIFSNTVGTLVQNQLRPGADRSRADAEPAPTCRASNRWATASGSRFPTGRLARRSPFRSSTSSPPMRASASSSRTRWPRPLATSAPSRR